MGCAPISRAPISTDPLPDYIAGAYSLVAATGGYTLDGQATLRNISSVIASGSYTLTGNPVNLKFGHKLLAALGAYSLIGHSVSVYFGRRLQVGAGSYVLAGQVTLKHLLAVLSKGSYTLTGLDVQLDKVNKTTLGVGNFVLEGFDVDLIIARVDRNIDTLQFTVEGFEIALLRRAEGIWRTKDGLDAGWGRADELSDTWVVTSELVNSWTFNEPI